MIREVIIWPDSILGRKCEPVTDFNDDLRRLLDDMGETMLAARGAGLAAPQVGYPIRAVTILVTRGPDRGQVREVLKLVNPVIKERTGGKLMREGCLSLPGHFEQVRRSEWVMVEAQDENGAKVEIEGDGLLAHSLQHELDHLDGVMFVDYVSSLRRNMARSRFARAKKKGMRYNSDRPTPQDFTQPSN